MVYPFQKLCYIDRGNRSLLLAAAGPHIYSFCLATGALLSTWPSTSDDGLSDDENGTGAQKGDLDEPPSKKRKLSTQDATAESSDSSISVEIVAERAKGQCRKRKIIDSKLPNVSHLIATKGTAHVIAVTTEDKCIRVFERESVSQPGVEGKLKLLSERCMPKRLCAIVLTPDDSSILAADKFGDVYSLPVLDIPPSKTLATNAAQKVAGDFKPSATELTVHTKGNREALRQQREQKAAAKTKEGPNFEHKLLLGHVSLLTDLIIAEADAIGKRRQYILTADRDEHIRVSRGPPQAHIIQNYCLDHKEFVSRLCILPWQPDVLVVGSGETSIKTFHWQTGQLLEEFSVFKIISNAITTSTHDLFEHKPLQKLAVSGIWPAKAKIHPGSLYGRCNFILVAFEGLPLLLSLDWSSTQKLVFHQIVDLPGNVLDVAYMQEQQTIIVSTDNVHKPGSVKQMRLDPAPLGESVIALELTRNHVSEGSEAERDLWWQQSNLSAPLSACLASGTFLFPELTTQLNAKATCSVLGEFLYGLENLRKNRSGVETAEETIPDDISPAKEMAD